MKRRASPLTDRARLRSRVYQTNNPRSLLHRYRIRISNHSTGLPSVRIHDRLRDLVLLEWHGEVVHHLLNSGVLPARFLDNGHYTCDKTFIWHLILTAAATEMALNQLEYSNCATTETFLQAGRRQNTTQETSGSNEDHQRSAQESLRQRLQRLQVQIEGPHLHIARMLFKYPGNHFSAAAVLSLMLLEYPVFSRSIITPELDDLAHWSVVQRIEIDADNVFYDINTTPHLHLFDPVTRELRDAPASGFVRVAQNRQPGRCS